MTSRRSFLAQGTGLALAFHVPLRGAGRDFEPNGYIRIASAGDVTFWITRAEMGQGVRTLLATVLADELEVEPENVKLEQAMPGARFPGVRLRTSGSGSSSGTFRALRTAGASARSMLVAAAAQSWSVEPSTCRAEKGSVLHVASGRRANYGELADAASRLPVPSAPVLKPAAEFRLIGRPRKRIGAAAIVRGQAQYGLDVRLPGMRVAVIARCPCPGGRLISFDPAGAKAVPGVREVLAVRSGLFGGGVAVVADHTWAAMKGREALRLQWDGGPNGAFDSDRFMESLRAAVSRDGYPIRRDGDWDAASAPPGQKLEAVYEYPFQAHAPLETMNCTAHVRAGSCEVWTPTQAPEAAQQNVMKSLGLPADAVQIHTTLLGGGFGRRLQVDYVDEAVELSKATGSPVQVLWTRDDDMRHGFFHPASVERMSAVLAGGKVSAWAHKSMGSDLSVVGVPTAEEKKSPQAYAKYGFPWGAADTFYNFAALRVDYVPVECPQPTGPWRAVMYPARVFARECFLDETAHALAKDPLALRIELLQPGGIAAAGGQEIDRSRMIRVLEETRNLSGWGQPLPAGMGRGLAINIYDADSYMAQVAEVSVRQGRVRVLRVVCVFDCGRALNPAGLEAQVESGIAWGLSAAVYGQIHFREGRAVETGYQDFHVVGMSEMPAIETHILSSTAAIGGFGEHPAAPIAPAVANAVFAATGKRLRKLPLA